MAPAKRLNVPAAPVKQQVANKAAWNESRLSQAADFFTFGYSGRTTEEILDSLKRHGVRTILDVRRNPISRYRPEVSKKNFARLLEENGMSYRHLPEFG